MGVAEPLMFDPPARATQREESRSVMRSTERILTTHTGAEALRYEYTAIINAGFDLQLDSPEETERIR